MQPTKKNGTLCRQDICNGFAAAENRDPGRRIENTWNLIRAAKKNDVKHVGKLFKEWNENVEKKENVHSSFGCEEESVQ